MHNYFQSTENCITIQVLFGEYYKCSSRWRGFQVVPQGKVGIVSLQEN